MNIKRLLIRYLYKTVHPVRKIYWFLVRPTTYGAKCLIENQKGEFLMIRNSYGSRKWTFPGGGVGRNESPEHAAIREAKEEVGVEVNNPERLGEYFHTFDFKKDTVQCYYKKVESDEFRIDPGEIEEAAWIPKDKIPENTSKSALLILEMYYKRNF